MTLPGFVSEEDQLEPRERIQRSRLPSEGGAGRPAGRRQEAAHGTPAKPGARRIPAAGTSRARPGECERRGNELALVGLGVVDGELFMHRMFMPSAVASFARASSQ